MSSSNFYNEYKPVNTNIPIEISGMEYFGNEQHQADLIEVVSKKENPVQILGRFDGVWDGQLDDAIKTATQVRYADREFHKDYLYEVYDLTNYPTIAKMPELLGFVKGKYRAQIQMQRPGCVMPRHIDPKEIFQIYAGHEGQCIRVLIALASWEYGQLLAFNNTFVTEWNVGDIIYCDYTSTWHFTANCSYHSRPLLQVTGVANNKLLDLIKNKQSRIIKI